MKTVDTREYLSVLEEMIRNGETVSVPISGYSMNPFLADKRDHVMVKQPDWPLKRGDIVLYRRRNGQFILHRIWKIRADGYYIVGDGQTIIEGPISRSQIIGKVIRIKRKGQWINEQNRIWRFFETIWIRIVPIRPILRKTYSFFAKMRRRRL